MGYLALYRKYRPDSFDSVYGQEEVVTVLRNAIVSNKISHAYLFSGPRGTGKTSIAKIIARLVNCENLENGNPCGKCYNCLNYFNSNDIVEIDAASNNGVDEIRELRDKINLVPSNSKYKVYIIDEVHMLTNQAFNALLKTLEEPPSHVIFILATTEPHKIPLTISSRCQKFHFSKIEDEKIVSRLRDIIKLEKIAITDDALYEIARLADGGMRDAINILDQLTAYTDKEISLDDIYNVNGSISYNDIYELLNDIKENNKIKIIEFFDNLDKTGKKIDKFAEELIIFLKDVLVYKNTKSLDNIGAKNESIKLVDALYSSNDVYSLVEVLSEVESKIKFSTYGTIIFMTSILKFSDKYGKDDVKRNISVDKKEKNIENSVKEEKIISREIILDSVVSDKNDDSIPLDEIGIRINNTLALASKDFLKEIRANWNKIDDYMYDSVYAAIGGILKDSVPVVGSKEYIMIANKYDSVVDRINANYKLIEELFYKLFGCKVSIVGISDDNWLKEKEKYILNIKNGVKYTVKEKNSVVTTKKVNNSIDELIDLVGDNIIEYK